jgi:phosphoglycolate phosphatase
LPGVPKKPDCTAAVEIARKMSIRPENILYLGDSGVDMLTASAPGCTPWRSLGLPHG